MTSSSDLNEFVYQKQVSRDRLVIQGSLDREDLPALTVCLDKEDHQESRDSLVNRGRLEIRVQMVHKEKGANPDLQEVLGIGEKEDQVGDPDQTGNPDNRDQEARLVSHNTGHYCIEKGRAENT